MKDTTQERRWRGRLVMACNGTVPDTLSEIRGFSEKAKVLCERHGLKMYRGDEYRLPEGDGKTVCVDCFDYGSANMAYVVSYLVKQCAEEKYRKSRIYLNSSEFVINYFLGVTFTLEACDLSGISDLSDAERKDLAEAVKRTCAAVAGG